MPRRITISDVAKHADVSTAAVSKVLRNAYGVSPVMRARVQKAIDELGYRPRAAARAMRGSTYTIGVLLSDIRNQFLADLIDGVTEQLRDTEYQVLLGPSGVPADTQERMIEALIDRSMDGLVLVSPGLPQPDLRKVAELVPVVVVGRHGHAEEYDSVVDDDVLGARLVIDHLADLGHRRVAHVTHADPGKTRVADLPHYTRAEGYRAAMRARGLEDEIDVVATSFTEEGGHAGMRELLTRDVRPTAVFAGADVAALGVLRAIYDAGLSVPEDISVASYDNTSLASLTPISLTSVDQSGHIMGVTSARLLLERIEGRTRSVLFSASPSLVVRGTTGPPARAGG